MGYVATYGQAAMLRAEGVEVSSELRILDLEKYKIKR